MFRQQRLFLSLALALAAGPASAAPGGGDPTRPAPAGVQLGCSVSPEQKKPGDAFQMADYTVTVKSGSVPSNTMIEIRLGSPGATTGVVTEFCSSRFARGTASWNDIPTTPPPPPGIWECVAKATAKSCPPPANPN
jgi:hypothetical protein